MSLGGMGLLVSFEEFHLPTLYLLQSYFCYVQCLEGEGNALLRRALKTAKLHGNLFDCGFIKHTAKAWSGEMSMTEQYFWTDHAEHEQIHVAEFDEDTMNLGYYTFRLPGFVAAYS